MIGGRGPQRRSPAIAIVVFIALVIGGTLSGCVPDAHPHPIATHTPSPTPVFASDDEALAAATDAYKAYLAMSDLIYAEGASAPERIDSVAAGDAKSEFLSSAKEFKTRGIKTSGTTTFDSVTLQSVRNGALGTVVTVYLCSDVSQVDVLDAEGKSIVSVDRLPRTPYEVGVLVSDSSIRVESRSAWSGQGIC